jgi:hypothetical protein
MLWKGRWSRKNHWYKFNEIDLSNVENKKIIRDKQYIKARTSNVNPGHIAFKKDFSNTLHVDYISQKMF